MSKHGLGKIFTIHIKQEIVSIIYKELLQKKKSKQLNLKMGERFEQTFYRKRWPNSYGPIAHEMVIHIINHKENTS